MRTNVYYEAVYYNGDTDDGMALVQAENNFFSLDSAIKFCEESQSDYVDLDGKLHRYDFHDECYVICDPESHYNEVDGCYLDVWNFYERDLLDMFDDAPSDNVYIVVED